jgi:hypothetical protein
MSIAVNFQPSLRCGSLGEESKIGTAKQMRRSIEDELRSSPTLEERMIGAIAGLDNA